MRKIYHLAVEATLDIIRGKWKLRILCHLGNGPLRTGELRRLMPGISQKMLTQSLKDLENAHIVNRRSYNEVPPQVEYSLTERGMSLRNILLEMSDWGTALVKEQQEEGDDVTILNPNDDGFKTWASKKEAVRGFFFCGNMTLAVIRLFCKSPRNPLLSKDRSHGGCRRCFSRPWRGRPCLRRGHRPCRFQRGQREGRGIW